MNKQLILILGVVIVAQLAVPFSMIQRREKILRDGETVRFKTRPIDPADPFQGRYVRLGFEEDYIAWPEEQDTKLKYKQPIYALIEINDEGFARFSGWSIAKPTEGIFLKTRFQGSRRQWNPETLNSDYRGLRIDLPFDRFYMDEAKAPRAETLVRDSTRTTNCWAIVRILDGKAVIEDVMAEGRSLRDLASEKE